MTRSNVSRSFSRKARRKSIQSFRIDSRWRRYVGIVRPTPIEGPETIRAGAGEGWAKVPQSHPVQEEVDRPAAGDETRDEGSWSRRPRWPSPARRAPRNASPQGPRDVSIDRRAEGLEGHRAVLEDRVVEGAQVEPRTEPRLRVGAKAPDLELADLVGERLSRPGDVAVHLVHDVVLREGGVREHELDRLVPGPALRVHARVDHEPARAPCVVGQHPDPVEVRGIQAHLVRQALRVEAPSLRDRRHPAVLSERWEALGLLRDGDLQMMSGDRLVVREDLCLVPRPRLRRMRVDVVPPRPRAVRGGRPVIGDRRVLLLVRLDADDLALGLRQPAEIPRDRATRAGEGLPGFVLDLVARAEVKGRVRAELLEDLGAVARPERLLP